MELRNRTALVTGGNGFVGAYVVRRLLEEGMRVRALVRSPAAGDELRARGAEVRLGELTDATAHAAAVAGVDVVVHCTATGTADLAEARQVNAAATASLAEAALAAGCERFVHLSTVAVYPLQGRDGPVGEDLPLVSEGDAYSLSKAEGERAIGAAIARGLRAVILRPVVIFGVHPTSFWGTRTPAAIAAGQFVHVDEGRTRLGYVHISSVVEAVVRALRSDDPAVLGEAFNLVDGHASWSEYTRHFSAGPLPSLPADQAPGFLSFRGSYAHQKAERLLGLVPRPRFEEYLDEIVRALPSTPAGG
ncbi:MAG TPA: NAD(P)-dependent oxidoreductase [Polyangiaceae bacterium]|nr:NAD(P)-dependent oxidoreductase [Polyangiaceae bacterium]